MQSHHKKLSRKCVSGIFAAAMVFAGGWAMADEPGAVHAAAPVAPVRPVVSPSRPAPVQPVATPAAPAQTTPNQSTPTQSTPTQSTPVQQARSGSAQPANQQAARDHDHDRDRYRRGTVVYLPWWGYTGPDGWTGTDGWTNYGNNTNNTPAAAGSGTYTIPNDPGTYQPTTQPAQPSVAGEAAQTTNAVDKSPEMVAANNAVQLAQVEYDKQRERVLAKLRDNPEYEKVAERRDNAAGDLNAAKATATTQPAVINAAQAKLHASSEVTKMQEQAVATDQEAAAAKTHLAEAVANRDALRAKLMAQH